MTDLYSFAPFDRSFRIRWLLEELGLPYGEQDLDYRQGQHRQAPYLALNPFGKIPVLSHDQETLFDSGAILWRLLERHDGEGRFHVQADQPGRDQYLSLYFHLCSSLDPMVINQLVMARSGLSQEQIDTRVATVKEQLVPLKARLEQGPYLMGEQFTALDILFGHLLGMVVGLGWVQEPLFDQYLARLAQRPASQLKALATIQ